MATTKNSVEPPINQKELLIASRMTSAIATALVFLGIPAGLILMFTPECTYLIEDSDSYFEVGTCLEKGWLTSITYGGTLIIVNTLTMSFLIMIARYIAWRVNTESQAG